MPANGRVFVSHSHEDNERCGLILTALDAWGVNYFFDTQGLGAGQQLNEIIQRELTSRDILLRICTASTQKSYWMSLEIGAFRGLQASDQKRGKTERLLINLVLDGDYTREPFDNATLFIDASSRPRAVWMADLARALGVPGAERARGGRMNRRAVVGYGAAALVAAGAAATAGALALDYHPLSAQAARPNLAPGGVVFKLSDLSPKNDVPVSPAVSGQTLYTMAGTTLTAFDLSRMGASGPAKLWSKPFAPQDTFVGPAAYGSTVYVGVDFTVYALDAATGAERWKVATPLSEAGTVDSTAVFGDGAIYILTTSGGVYAYEERDGAQRWSARIDDSASLGPLTPYASGPTPDGATVYIGSFDHNVYALNTNDGSIKWKTRTNGAVISTPDVAAGVVYVGSSDHYVYALNAGDGSVKWRFLTGGRVLSSPNVVDGVVYIAAEDHYLYALDAITGKPYWRAPIGDVDNVTGDITNSGSVYCQPAVTGDAVVVMDMSHYIVRSYSRRTGDTRWTYTSKDTLQNAFPVGANGEIFFGSGDRTLYVFGA